MFTFQDVDLSGVAGVATARILLRDNYHVVVQQEPDGYTVSVLRAIDGGGGNLQLLDMRQVRDADNCDGFEITVGRKQGGRELWSRYRSDDGGWNWNKILRRR